MRSAGIMVNLHYIPVYRQPYYEKMGFSYNYCPNAERYYKEAISIPIYSSLSFEQQQYVISNIRELLAG
jgi:dTDP-4-amino-4,6-dideoxygalactose transaminase